MKFVRYQYLQVQATLYETSIFIWMNPANASFYLNLLIMALICRQKIVYIFIVLGTTVYYYVEAGF